MVCLRKINIKENKVLQRKDITEKIIQETYREQTSQEKMGMFNLLIYDRRCR